MRYTSLVISRVLTDPGKEYTEYTKELIEQIGASTAHSFIRNLVLAGSVYMDCENKVTPTTAPVCPVCKAPLTVMRSGSSIEVFCPMCDAGRCNHKWQPQIVAADGTGKPQLHVCVYCGAVKGV